MMKSQNRLQSLRNQSHYPIMITIQILGLVVPRKVMLGLEEVGKVLLQGVVA